MNMTPSGYSGNDNSPETGLSLNGATRWLNTQPLTLADLRGEVVLINFWTYTCINWRRTLPFTQAWASKYKNKGLVVIGVHTPEFPFEHKLENVKWAVSDMNVSYPVAIDNNFEIWRSFRNEYWPALYLIDATGVIRYQKFGEGDYLESELHIQELLKEVSDKNVLEQPVQLQPRGFEAAADWANVKSTENHLGYSQSVGFTSPTRAIPDVQTNYSLPSRLKLNQWGLSGEWVVGKEFVSLAGGQGKILYRFHARDLNLIMGALAHGAAIKFRVLIDGQPPGAAHGLDTDESGTGAVTIYRTYQVIRQQGPIIDRDFEIEFSGPVVEVFDFMFG